MCIRDSATCAPIANPPNSAQLGGSLYHASKLHPGPYSSVGVRRRTDTHTHTQTHTHRQTRVTTIHFASSTTHAKCNNVKNTSCCLYYFQTTFVCQYHSHFVVTLHLLFFICGETLHIPYLHGVILILCQLRFSSV